MANIASRLHRMLEERDVDGAFLAQKSVEDKANHKNGTDKAVVCRNCIPVGLMLATR